MVHHARKGAAHARQGQALRGSSEFHAWGDSNLYLRRSGDQLTLATEHRDAASTTGIPLALRVDEPHIALEVVTPAPRVVEPPALTPADKVEHAPVQAGQPVALAALRQFCRMRTATLGQVLAELARQGRVRKTSAGYQVVSR